MSDEKDTDVFEIEGNEQTGSLALPIADIFGAGGPLSKALPGYESRPSQVELAEAVYAQMTGEYNLCGEGPCGCHAKGQKILMFDGDVKYVEDIEVGERLMGPGGTQKTVLKLIRGIADLFEIIPVKGDPWRVNGGHVLTLVRQEIRSLPVGKPRRKDYRSGEIVDVTVDDYLKWALSRKALYRLFRSEEIEFSGESVLKIDPYHLGAMLGDGTMVQGSVGVSTPDPEVVEVVNEIAEWFGLRVRKEKTTKTAPTYYIAGKIGNKYNLLIDSLRLLGLYGCNAYAKFIPFEYKTASIDDRRKILAGLLDTDGHLSTGCFDYISASMRLADDIAFVCRSLGLAAYVSESLKKWQGGKSGVYWRVSISGDFSDIPCRVSRRIAGARRQKKSVLVTGFEIVECWYSDNYYGFTLDGDGRYLLEDFTVTHNSGKSLAYLIPTVKVAGKTVIATANIALQEQLVTKDLPLVRDVFGDFEFVLLKGRNNYVCQERIGQVRDDLHGKGVLFKGQFALDPDQADHVIQWAMTTDTGDKSELPFEPHHKLWGKCSSTKDDCLGSACEHKSTCFVNVAREGVKTADVIVTNYHILFAFVKVLAEEGFSILPEFDRLICDEAHKIADIAKSFFGWELRKVQFTTLLNAFNNTGNGLEQCITLLESLGEEEKAKQVKYGVTFDELDAVSDRLADVFRVATEDFWLSCEQLHETTRHYNGMGCTRILNNNAGLAIDDIANCLRLMAATFWLLAEHTTENVKVQKRLRQRAKKSIEFGKHLIELSGLDDPNGVYFTERRGGEHAPLSMVKRKVDVSEDLWHGLFSKQPTFVTSATLAVGGNCEFIREQMGLKESREIIVDSPFDFEAQALMVLSRRAPDPTDRQLFPVQVSKVITHILKKTAGRALCLFTSYTVLKAVQKHLSDPENNPNGYTIFCQGDMPRIKLVEKFRTDVHSVLLGVESFWAGVDVPGPSLSCVIIDKIPFKSPGDPVWDAMCERAGNQWFRQLSIPTAAIQLKQGVGRLIRSGSDRGVVVVLDRRMLTKPYGGTLIDSLPKMTAATTLTGDVLSKFIEGEQW